MWHCIVNLRKSSTLERLRRVYWRTLNRRRRYVPTCADTGIEQDDYFSTLGKAFVGLRLMLEAYPTKKWFVVLGDDNYVLLDNYVNVLSAFDPEQPWALSRMVHRNKFGCKVRTSIYLHALLLLYTRLCESAVSR